MWWGNSSDKDPKAPSKETPAAQGKSASANDAAPFDPNKLPSRGELPPALQKIVEKSEKEENFFDDLVDGYVPQSTDSNLRFAAYASRVRTIMLSAHRYVAYTSDIGESFRPVAHPWLVRSAYGISWAYIAGDVSYEGYKAYRQNKARTIQNAEKTAKSTGSDTLTLADAHPQAVPPLENWKTVVVQRAIFQSIASMGLPAFTIHSVVRYSGRALKDVKNKTIRTWGPIGLGLAVVPFLPSLFDQPVESAVEWALHKSFETFGGHAYVGEAPVTGREKALGRPPKEKEL